MSEHDDELEGLPEEARKGAISWMARNDVAANLLMLLIIVVGLASAFSTKQEVFPEFDLDVVTVSVPYPGASPAEVEQGIVLAVEEAVRGVDGVKKVTSTSAEGAGSVAVELLLGADPDKALADIKNEIDRIQTFPEDAEDPTVALASRRSKVVSLVISGDLDDRARYALAEKARAELLARGGVTQAEVEGLPPLEVSVEVPPHTLEAYGLTLDDVARQIAAGSLELPGGGLDTTGGEILVRVADRAQTLEDFAEIPIVGAASGARVLLGDIATLRDGFEDNDQSTYFDGKPAVLVTAYRVGSETPAGVAQAVRTYAQDLEAALPDGVRVTIWDDDSELLAGRIQLLLDNGMLGMVLVFIVLALFLDMRLAFWVGLGIPISFGGAFLFFPSLAVSINMVSLFALIITLGLVVDDAIVVGENIYEKTEQGMTPMQAAIVGAQQMAMPVTFAILTTFAAFAPLLTVPGVTGKIFGIIPIVVLAVLSFSLLESFFVLPAHLGHTWTVPKAVSDVVYAIEAPRRVMTGVLKRFIDGPYSRALTFGLKWRYASLGLAVAVLVVSVGFRAAGMLPFSFLPKTEADIVRVTARLPYGAPIENTAKVRDALQEALDRALADLGGQDGTRGTLTLLGQGGAGGGPNAGNRPVGSHLLAMEVDLVASELRDFEARDLKARWEAEVPRLPGVESLTFISDIGASAGAAVDVQLASQDREVLAAASEEVADLLRGYADLTNISNGYAAGKPQLDYEVTPAGETLGLTNQLVARQMRSAFFGAEALREQRGRSEVKVMVRLPEADRVTAQTLDDLRIRTPLGGYAPLPDVARATRSQAATSIDRDAGQRVVDVIAELAPTAKSAERVLEDLTETKLPELRERYPGLTVRFAGEQESQNEALGVLGQNYLVAVLAMYVLLAVPFKSYVQPLIIMFAIPFGVVGAFAGHLVMGFEISVISVMGIIALSGVVVNDSLVLIDAANTFRREGMNAWEAIVAAGQRRFRPILLTSLTTFFGLMPMIFETSVQARFLIPMAISLGFGVLFATVIVLLIVPALYLVVEDGAVLLRWVFSDEKALEEYPVPLAK